MKKTLLLTVVLLLSVMVSAQSRLSYISEHFDSEDIPDGWTFEGDGSIENWQIWQTHMAGGEPNEIKLYWKPSFTGVARMVTPAVDLSGVSEVTLSFKGFLDNYQNSHTLGIATTSDNGATWNIAWQNTYSNDNQGQHSITQNIKTSDIGKENVKFCIFFEGTSGYINGWYFDDIEIFTIDELNLGILSFNMPDIIGINNNDVSFIVKNTGSNNVTNFSASYQIDDNEAVVENFKINIASLEEQEITFEKKLSTTPGSHSLTISILDVNNSQDNEEDNVMTKELDIAYGSIQRTPMIEHFSSPTCAPCVMVNEAMELLTKKYQGKYTYTKYPLDYPAPGDIYFNDECRTKKAYYNIMSAPTIIFDGDFYGNSEIIDADFEKQYQKPAYIDIKGTFNVNNEDSTINVTIDVLPYTNIPEKKLFVSVNEKTTTENQSYNGEKEFHHIMMKMLADANGNDIDLKAREMQHFEFSYDMNLTNMEELNDLEVAAWIQDYHTQEIFNSQYLYENTEHPYPAQNLRIENNDNKLTINWDAPENVTPIGYNIYINDKIIAENTNEMSYSYNITEAGLYVVNIIAVYENNKTSVGIIDHIMIEAGMSIAETTSSLEIYPNPTKDNLYIKTEMNVEEINIYDIYGRLRHSTSDKSDMSVQINVSDLNKGIYFIEINTDKDNIIKKFIKD